MPSRWSPWKFLSQGSPEEKIPGCVYVGWNIVFELWNREGKFGYTLLCWPRELLPGAYQRTSQWSFSRRGPPLCASRSGWSVVQPSVPRWLLPVPTWSLCAFCVPLLLSLHPGLFPHVSVTRALQIQDRKLHLLIDSLVWMGNPRLDQIIILRNYLALYRVYLGWEIDFWAYTSKMSFCSLNHIS